MPPNPGGHWSLVISQWSLVINPTPQATCMNVLIIEDEKPAADKLERYIKRYDPGIRILAKLESIQQVQQWFHEDGREVDLLFMDIQLSDGLSFEVFRQTAIQKPVIFTTAYSEYAIEAFKANGIDYLLKPITYESLASSMQKLEVLRNSLPSKKQAIPLENLSQLLAQWQKKTYKTRFMVRLGEHIHSVSAESIALFNAIDRDVFLYTTARKKFIIDYTLEDLEDILDPALFFRVNRSLIVQINAIRDVLVYSSSRLKIHLHQEFDKEIIVSRERVNTFKEWFNGNISATNNE
jgi:two-component system, LytTR family, response regulator